MVDWPNAEVRDSAFRVACLGGNMEAQRTHKLAHLNSSAWWQGKQG
jgi:hypothetical protein